jgi:hypothetical protein
MSAEIEEEDVNSLSFGADFDGAVFLPNSSIALLLQKIAEKKYGERAPPEYVGCQCEVLCAGRASRLQSPSFPSIVLCHCRVFAKAKTYASAFGGAVELTDVAAIDELYTSLRSLEFVREALDAESGEPVVTKVKLHEYQVRNVFNKQELIARFLPLSTEGSSCARSCLCALLCSWWHCRTSIHRRLLLRDVSSLRWTHSRTTSFRNA